MKIFIDESGNFNLSNRKDVSVLASVILPENKEYKLNKIFEKLYSVALPAEKDANGEVKGSKLSPDNIKLIFEFLSKNIDFRISLYILDHEINQPSDIVWHRKEQAKVLGEGKNSYFQGPVKAKEILDFFDEKIRWTKRADKISNVDYTELSLLVELIRESFQKALIHYYRDKYRSCFKEFFLYIDRKNKRIKKPEKYISQLILGYLETVRAGREPVDSIDVLSRQDHPMSKFHIETEDGKIGWNLKKIFEHGLLFEDSKKFFGLQLADILASVTKRIILGNVEKEFFNLIRKNSALYKNGECIHLMAFREKNLSTSKKEIFNFLRKHPSIKSFFSKKNF